MDITEGWEKMDRQESILIVDDDRSTRRTLTLILREKGYETHTAGTGKEAMETVRKRPFNAAFLDIKLPDTEGTELLKALKEIHPDMVVLMVTAYASVETAIYALNEGASGYLTKPMNMDEALIMIESALDKQRLAAENRRLLEELQKELVERKRIGAELAAERERLTVTLRSIGDGVITTDVEGKVALVNGTAEALIGWTEEESAGRPLIDVFHIINEDTRERCENPVERVFETGGIIGLANRTVLVAKDGTERIIADSGAPIRDKDSNIIGVVLVFRDITERRRLEEELQKIQKLESVGILAGGIAHDLNNLLTGVIGNISLARMYEELAEKDRRLAEAEKASMQIRDLTQQLLTFSRGGSPILRTADMGKLLRDSASFALRGSNVGSKFSISDDLWPVEMDEGQINQVISNLVINAQQAMPAGGIVRVSAENITMGTESGLPLEPGAYTKVSVEDQGIGISEEYLQRIFDPFFSTKQAGSGLGLATSYSIIQKHNGHITVESQPGLGSTFNVYLPASPDGVLIEEEKEEKPIMGEGRILVMDDEEHVRDTAADMLRSIGYEVATSINGSEAIELYKEAMVSGKPFDVVIMDLTVPGGIGGKEAIQKLIEIDPEVKAIVSSGYSTDPIMAGFREYGFKGVIAKPYRTRGLSVALRKVVATSDE